MPKTAKKKRNVDDSVSPGVGDLIHAKFGTVWFNGTVLSLDGDHFVAHFSDDTEERISCDPNCWSPGHLEDDKPAKKGRKKTTKKKPVEKKPKPPPNNKTKKPTKAQLTAAAKKEKIAKAKALKAAAKARLTNAAAAEANVPFPTWHCIGYSDLPDKGKHIVAKSYQNEHFKIGGATMGPHMYGFVLTEHIEFTKRHPVFGGKAFCRLQCITVERGHAATPPKKVDLVIWSIKIPVEHHEKHRILGGKVLEAPRAIVLHMCESSASKETVFEIGLDDIITHDTKLKAEYGDAVDLVAKVDEKCRKWIDAVYSKVDELTSYVKVPVKEVREHSSFCNTRDKLTPRAFILCRSKFRRKWRRIPI